jgi:hypothetical protein
MKKKLLRESGAKILSTYYKQNLGFARKDPLEF